MRHSAQALRGYAFCSDRELAGVDLGGQLGDAFIAHYLGLLNTGAADLQGLRCDALRNCFGRSRFGGPSALHVRQLRSHHRALIVIQMTPVQIARQDEGPGISLDFRRDGSYRGRCCRRAGDSSTRAGAGLWRPSPGRRWRAARGRALRYPFDCLDNLRSLCATHDASVKELPTGGRRRGGSFVSRAVCVDGWPRDWRRGYPRSPMAEILWNGQGPPDAAPASSWGVKRGPIPRRPSRPQVAKSPRGVKRACRGEKRHDSRLSRGVKRRIY